MIVQNKFPSRTASCQLAIVGEAPGEEEERTGIPFTGASGRLLNKFLIQNKIDRDDVFLGNCVQSRPFKNNIKVFKEFSIERVQGANQLAEDIIKADPNCILLLGQTPLTLAGIDYAKIGVFRGSIFKCDKIGSPFYGRKCVAALHPAYCLRSQKDVPLLQFDIGRAAEERHTKELILPQRKFYVEQSSSEIIRLLDQITEGTVSIDIEGGIDVGIRCVGVSINPSWGFIVNIHDFSESEKYRIFRALVRLLRDPNVAKVLQNGLYDAFCFAWLWKVVVVNQRFDTMLSGWEHYPELPKGLDTQVSIWLRDPYYKNQRKAQDKLAFYSYCVTDACVTLDIHKRHMEEFKPDQKAHYDFNVGLLPAFLYMELRGIKYNREGSNERLAEIELSMSQIQSKLDFVNGGPININSPKQMAEFLYVKLKFPSQYKKNEEGENVITTDIGALLTLVKKFEHNTLYDVMKWRKFDSQREQLNFKTDADGRMRCQYNIVGTETGRLTCYASPTGSGTNLTTIMKQNRDLFVADENYWFFQCDLEGADGWTVAAHCARLGDDRMLKDYQFEPIIKPARVIALMYLRYVEGDHAGAAMINKMSREELVDLIRSTEIPDWLYFACKRVQHGSNYLLGPITMANVILKDSWNQLGEPCWVEPKICKDLQTLYMSRYKGVAWWHQDTGARIRRNPTMECASGHTRQFFSPPGDHETLREALAHEPQANTTYSTNRAARELYHNPNNRRGKRFIVEPLHQVHDALCGQFHKDDLERARVIISNAFNQSVTIAGLDLVIPYEGHYGPNWSSKYKEGKI